MGPKSSVQYGKFIHLLDMTSGTWLLFKGEHFQNCLVSLDIRLPLIFGCTTDSSKV